jgi:uncharacterized membrane protein YqjE
MTAPVSDYREHDEELPPISEILTDLSRDVSELMSTQMELAVVEIKEEARQAARAGGMLGVGGLLGYLTLILASFTFGFALADLGMDLWTAFLVVTVFVGIGAAALIIAGRQVLTSTDPVPRQTLETLQEDRTWLKQQIS